MYSSAYASACVSVFACVFLPSGVSIDIGVWIYSSSTVVLRVCSSVSSSAFSSVFEVFEGI